MTRLELATPTLARLCATNCATSACSRIAPGTCKTLPDPSAGAKPSRFPRVGHQPQGLSIRGRSRHPLVSSLALWGFPPNFCTRRSRGNGRLAQLVARFLHTEEVIGSSPVSPTELPRESFDFRGFVALSPTRRFSLRQDFEQLQPPRMVARSRMPLAALGASEHGGLVT